MGHRGGGCGEHQGSKRQCDGRRVIRVLKGPNAIRLILSVQYLAADTCLGHMGERQSRKQWRAHGLATMLLSARPLTASKQGQR